MTERILIAGSGGQGVILLGKLVASVALSSDIPHITFFPSYGAEVRGGTSNCQVILSSEEIASPVADRFDTLLLMNQACADTFLSHRASGSLIVLNSSLCASVKADDPVVTVDATERSHRLFGTARSANFIMLGALLSVKPILSPALIETGIRSLMDLKKPDLVDVNIRAFREGMASRTSR